MQFRKSLQDFCAPLVSTEVGEIVCWRITDEMNVLVECFSQSIQSTIGEVIVNLADAIFCDRCHAQLIHVVGRLTVCAAYWIARCSKSVLNCALLSGSEDDMIIMPSNAVPNSALS